MRVIDAHAHSLHKDEDSHRIALAGTTHRNSLDLLESFSERDEIFIGYGLHPWFIEQHHYKYNEVKWDEFDFIGIWSITEDILTIISGENTFLYECTLNEEVLSLKIEYTVDEKSTEVQFYFTKL